MTPQQPNGGPTADGMSGLRSFQDRSPDVTRPPAAPVISGGSLPAAGRTRPIGHPETVFSRPRRTGHRPDVQPLPPDAHDVCLCGDPAELVVDTHWFSGRHSRDPVCRRHVTEIVAAIIKRQARRDGR